MWLRNTRLSLVQRFAEPSHNVFNDCGGASTNRLLHCTPGSPRVGDHLFNRRMTGGIFGESSGGAEPDPIIGFRCEAVISHRVCLRDSLPVVFRFCAACMWVFRKAKRDLLPPDFA
jgi:hypothetical protein